jgi:hypothetical protein
MTVEWGDAEKSIILITISAPITWEMFDEGTDEALRLAATVPHRVDMISNPGATQMPPGTPIPHLKRAFENFPPNVGILASIITNLFARTMSSVAGQAYLGPRFKIVSSIDHAYQVIHKQRAETEANQAVHG